MLGTKTALGFDAMGRAPAMGFGGIVSSGHPLATAAGLQILREGGNAFDAAIAMAAVIAVVEPSSNHLGGDAFAILKQAEHPDPIAVNASGPAPAMARADQFPDGIDPNSLQAASVPGAVSAWDAIVSRFGRLGLDRVLRPAIRYAEQGFPVGYALSQALASSAPNLRRFASSAAVFLPGGAPPGPAHRLIQPDLQRTLESIASGGSGAFYRGRFAEALDACSRSEGGLLRASDLWDYQCAVLDPLWIDYRGYAVAGQPPVSQGYVLLAQLNIVEGFDLGAMGFGSGDATHVMLEAKKLAFADRHAYLGDPRRVRMEMPKLLSRALATQRRATIQPDRAVTDPAAGELGEIESDTTALSAVDAEGNAITYIQSLFKGFGCSAVVDGTGVVMNNRMSGFSLDPTSPNYLEPGKKTMHTLNTYMVLKDNKVWLLGASPGGHFQVQSNFQVISNMIDHGMNVQTAIEAPRWYHDELTGQVSIEGRFPAELASDLQGRGHDIRREGLWTFNSRAQAIAIDHETGALFGGTDPRWHGVAVGI